MGFALDKCFVSKQNSNTTEHSNEREGSNKPNIQLMAKTAS
jgi:hypothetical protein